MSAKRSMSRALTREESYQDGHLTRTAFISIAILTFITFVGNFTQLQLSAALPTIVSDFGISVTTGQWLTSIFQLVMGVICFFAAQMLLQKKFRIFNKRWWLETAAMVLVLAAVTVCVKLDFTGYQHRVPDAEDVTSARFRAS